MLTAHERATIHRGTAVCTAQRHERMKISRPVFEAWTRFAYWQPEEGAAPMEYRDCKLCGSSLSDGTRQALAAGSSSPL